MNCQTIELKYNDIYKTLMNGNKNYIFGCGWMGRNFAVSARQTDIKIEGFVVSDKNQHRVDNLPVYDLFELEDINCPKNVFVALRDQDDILNKRLEKICEVVYPITYPEDITVMAAQYYINLLKNIRGGVEREYITIKGFQFVNPFLKSYDYLLSWVYEAGDLLLPGLLNNYERVDEGPYEYDKVILQEDDVVLDCGANIGLFSAIAIQKGCHVYAFEPMPAAIQYLQEVQAFLDSKLKICPYALSDYSGKADFHVQNFDLLGASLLENNNSIDRDYVVNVITVDEFVERNGIEKVNFIKADIEGSERDMITGAKETIRRFAPKLSICTYHLSDDKQVIESRIKEINPDYVIEHKWKKLFAYIPEEKEINQKGGM